MSKSATVGQFTGQERLDARIDDAPLSLDDWELPGLGEPGPDCGKDRMPEENAICPNGDAVRYEPLLCRRLECPDCYESEQRDRIFDNSVEIEAAARVRDDRPHAVTFSTPKEESVTYSITDINEKLMQTGYDRASDICGIEGGIAVVHPARVLPDMKDILERLGYGSGDGEDGWWRGIREDVCVLEDWRDYCYYSPHGHSIGFPGYIKPHESDGEFIVEKYRSLDNLGAVIGHLEYLFSHRGSFRGEGSFTSVRRWGEFHHAANGWDGAEEELPGGRVEQLMGWLEGDPLPTYGELCREVAAEMGGEWNADEGFHYNNPGECPQCGAPKKQFIDLWDLPRMASSSWQGGQEWIERLSPSQRAFFQELIEILHHDQEPRIYRDDLIHPDDIAIWIDEGDRPPP